MANEMIVIIDDTKCVQELGRFPLPVEIVPFAYQATLHKIRSFGCNPIMRANADASLFITDNGNFITDLHFLEPPQDIQNTDRALHSIPGVVETGLFVNMAGRVIIGLSNGSTTLLR